MKQRLLGYGEGFLFAATIGFGIFGAQRLLGGDQITLNTTNTWLTSKGYTAMDIMNEMATEKFAKSKGTIANYYKKHESCTWGQYSKDCANDRNCNIALAHHNIEMLYRRIQVARELDMITDEMVHAIMSKEDIEDYVSNVLPLNNISSYNNKQRAFWQKYIPEN